MLEGYAEHRPAAPLDRFIHRMAHPHFTQGLPLEHLAPDSYIKLAFIFSGEPTYYAGDGERLPWRDGFVGHISPGKVIITTSAGAVRCLMVNFHPSAFHQLFGLPVHQLNVGLSYRQLQRRFKEEVGLSPKEFSSVVHFNHLYNHMQRTRKPDLEAALA